ncbi:MAG: KH domain-containing protein [Clostridia bacterium]|nr:KH domain-containing protein [Clostridia bacterium]
MIKEAFGTGDTIEEARLAALNELGLDADQTEFDIETEILEQPEKKILGLFGGKQAKVRVFYEISENPSKKAAEYLKNIVDALGVENAKITVNENENGAELCLEGDKMGLVIGRRGETLDAIQYLTSLVANHVNGSYYRISINTGDYREKRDGSLTSLAKRTSNLALKVGKNIALEPMNPYERRIIHTAVQEIEGVSSWSVGENEKRHVVIGPEGVSEGEDGQPLSSFERRRRQNGGYNRGRENGRGSNRRYNGNRGGYSKNRSSRSSYSQPGSISDVERKPKNEAVSAPLYGKIEIK